MVLWSLKIYHEGKVTAYIVNFNAFFWGQSYIYSLLNQFITLTRQAITSLLKKGFILFVVEYVGWYWHSCVASSGNFWILLVSIKTFCLQPPASLFCRAASTDVCDLILDTNRKCFNTLKILWFWFLLSKPSGTGKFAHLTELWDGLWHVLVLLLQALSPHHTQRLEKNSGMGILAVTMAFCFKICSFWKSHPDMWKTLFQSVVEDS